MKRYLFLLFILSFPSFGIVTKEQIKPLDYVARFAVDTLEGSAENGNAIKRNCSTAEESTETNEMFSLKVGDGSNIELNVISMEKAQMLFDYIEDQDQIPFFYPEEGCYARAMEMARILDQMGVNSAKVFVEGDLVVKTYRTPFRFVLWDYHVAPVIAVRDGEEIKLMTLDPSIMKRPVTVDEWVAHQTGGRPEEFVTDLYYTSKFNYTPNQRNLKLNEYREKDLKSTKEEMYQYLEVQKERINYMVSKFAKATEEKAIKHTTEKLELYFDEQFDNFLKENNLLEDI